jgi:hypothetical protein
MIFFQLLLFQSLEKENPEPSFKPRSELGGFIFFIDAGNFHSFCHNIFLAFHILGITKQQHPQLGQTVLQQIFCKSKLAKTHKSPKHPSSSSNPNVAKKTQNLDSFADLQTHRICVQRNKNVGALENLLYLYLHLSLNSLLFFPFGVYFFADGRRLGAKPVFVFYFPSLSLCLEKAGNSHIKYSLCSDKNHLFFQTKESLENYSAVSNQKNTTFNILYMKFLFKVYQFTSSKPTEQSSRQLCIRLITLT